MLTTSIAAFAAVLAIVRIGAVPVFADVDGFDLADLEACDGILRDSHSLDLRWRGEATVSVGEFAATSFYPTKNLGSLGDGGAILTNAGELADSAFEEHAQNGAARREPKPRVPLGFGGASSALCAFEEHAQNGAARREPKSRVPLGFGGASSALCASKYRNYGRTAKYRHELPGYISRLDELHAALLRRVGLANLDDWTARRRAIALRYLGCIDNGRVSIPGAPAHSEYVWHLLPVLVEPESRLGFLAHLKANGISAAEHYPAALFEQPVMGVPYEMPAVCSNARRLCQSEVSLPIQPYLTDDECVRVIEACNGWSG